MSMVWARPAWPLMRVWILSAVPALMSVRLEEKEAKPDREEWASSISCSRRGA